MSIELKLGKMKSFWGVDGNGYTIMRISLMSLDYTILFYIMQGKKKVGSTIKITMSAI